MRVHLKDCGSWHPNNCFFSEVFYIKEKWMKWEVLNQSIDQVWRTLKLHIGPPSLISSSDFTTCARICSHTSQIRGNRNLIFLIFNNFFLYLFYFFYSSDNWKKRDRKICFTRFVISLSRWKKFEKPCLVYNV